MFLLVSEGIIFCFACVALTLCYLVILRCYQNNFSTTFRVILGWEKERKQHASLLLCYSDLKMARTKAKNILEY